jgi:hypothetical protein
MQRYTMRHRMQVRTDRSDVIGRPSGEQTPPLAVTVRRACEISGLGPTTIWNFLRDGRLDAVRVRGVRRTLVRYASLVQLLAPASASPPPRRRGRPRKLPAVEATP